MVKIKKMPNLDKTTPSRTIVKKQINQHQKEVQNLMDIIATVIQIRGASHDLTKKTYFYEFYEDIIERNTNNTPYLERKWGKLHTTKERHHLNARIPVDINLIDVLEFICDCISTGYERDSFDINYLQLDSDVLQLAYKNTIIKLQEEVDVEHDE